MRVFRDLDNLPAFKNSVLTIGTFDGVHIGHQKIITKIEAVSKQIKGENIIITFHPHPRIVIQPQDKSLRLLNTIEEKIALLEKYGVDNLVIVPFSRDFSEQTAEGYITGFLVRNFQPRCIVIGYNHRFGKDRSGDYHLLEAMKQQYAYEMEEITKEALEEIDVSSSQIRYSLQHGDVRLANELLGHRYTLTGTVIKGLQNGKKMGFPTANIRVPDEYKLIPKTGIYAVRVYRGQQVYGGMLSIGYNPTFNGNTQTIEVNILDFDEDIYGEILTLEFIEFVRDERKFNSPAELAEEIKRDEKKIRAILQAL